MKEDETIQNFFDRVTNIVNNIRLYGDTIEDKKIVQKVLRSLPPKFDHIVAAIEESKDLSKLTVIELTGSLQAHEERLRRFSDQPLEQAFQAKLKFSNNGDNKNEVSHGRNFLSKRGASNNHGRGRGNYKNQGSRENKKSSQYCRLCKMSNHNTNECRYKCKKCTWHTHHIRDCRNRQRNEVNFTENNDSAENVFYSCLNTQQESQDLWYKDSGCSNHMTGNKNSFVRLDEQIKSSITFGDRRTQEVAGKGTIAVKSKNSLTKYIQDVLYVPGLV